MKDYLFKVIKPDLQGFFNELPKYQKVGSDIFYRTGIKSSGSKEWHIEGMVADTKMTVVIK